MYVLGYLHEYTSLQHNYYYNQSLNNVHYVCVLWLLTWVLNRLWFKYGHEAIINKLTLLLLY